MSEFDVVLEHVSKTYPGGARAVIDFSAELKHGEFVAMLGPSGCGKTTTLRMIGGLEEATEGKIFIAGQGRHRPAAGAARYLDDVPELRAVSPSHGFPERRIQPEDEGHGKERARPARLGNARDGGAFGFRHPTAKRPVRRSAAARRLGARLDQPADRAPARRAARIARFQSAPGDDDRTEKGAT